MTIYCFGQIEDLGVANITGCTVKNMNVADANANNTLSSGGGILGFNRSKYTNIENCRVEEINLEPICYFGGIVGSTQTPDHKGNYLRGHKYK